MTVGQTAATADAILDAEFGGSAYSGNAAVYLQLHTGDPGSDGTSNASAETTREELTFAGASGGSNAASEVTWSSWTAGSETISHVSIWDADTSGNFICSGALSASKAMTNGDSLGITVTATQGPIAA